TVFILSSLNDDLKSKRMERYLLLCWESGANPVIVLTKSDTCTDSEEKKNQVENILIGAKVVTISAVNQDGIEELMPYLSE
ncbi:GTPase RsgA, partial [Micrococcus sp. SIMBA_144]